MWSLLGRNETLGYGEVVNELRSTVGVELINALPDGWPEHYEKAIGEDPVAAWEQTVREFLELLGVVEEGLSSGSLGDPEATMDALGCFDRRVNGAGTVSAAAAFFLASRNATSPAAGILGAAFMHDADTDTIASMTGSLLGALLGAGWLGDLGRSVQDAPYIRDLAEMLIDGGELDHPLERVTQSSLDRFTNDLKAAQDHGQLWIGVLPDGREAQVRAPLRSESLTPKLAIVGWTGLISQTGSRSLSRSSNGSPIRVRTTLRPSDSAGSVSRCCLGLKYLATFLRACPRIYEHVLGLALGREESQLVNYGEVLTLVERTANNRGESQLGFDSGDRSVMIFLEVAPIDEVFRRVRAADVTVLSPVGGRNRRFFRCLDPDGAVVEVREAEQDP